MTLLSTHSIKPLLSNQRGSLLSLQFLPLEAGSDLIYFPLLLPNSIVAGSEASVKKKKKSAEISPASN
jgi:hypothetical protein